MQSPKAKRGRPKKVVLNQDKKNIKPYCIFKKNLTNSMIGCDKNKCSIQWFHLECINLKHVPKGKWYCHFCK